MAFRPYYDTEDEVPAELRDHYVHDEDHDVFVLQVEGADGWAVENVGGLRSTLGKLKDRATKAENQLKVYRDLGHQPNELAAAMQELEELRQTSGKSSSERVQQLEQQIEQMRQATAHQLEQETAPLRTRLDARTKQTKELLVDVALAKAIADAKGEAHMLQPALEKHVRTEELEDGTLQVVVVDADGTPRVTGKNLEPMGIADLVKEYQADARWAKAFNLDGPSGGGTPPDGGTPRGAVTADRVAGMSMDEYKAAREKGAIK